MSAETPGTDHDDTEALAGWLSGQVETYPADESPGGQETWIEISVTDLAERILASDWLAAYVARKVAAERAETRRWREMWDKHGKNDLLARAEQAERIDAALTSTTEPASARPLTLDEHLAEIERRISLRACITGTDRHLDIIRAYREEVRRG